MTMRHVDGPDAAAARTRTTLDFEDIDFGIDYPAVRVPAGYHGLTWDGFTITDKDVWGGLPNGYQAGATSGRQILASQGTSSITIDGSFNLVDLQLTAGFAKRLEVRIDGYVDGELAYSKTVRVGHKHAKDVDIHWQGVDEVRFEAFVVQYDRKFPWYSYGPDFVIDDLTIARVNGDDAAVQPDHVRLPPGVFGEAAAGPHLHDALAVSAHSDALHLVALA